MHCPHSRAGSCSESWPDCLSCVKGLVMRESVIEAYLAKRVKEAGGEIRKAEWIGRRGAPDRRVMLPGRMPVWVELKAPGEKPTAQQIREHNRMRRLGELVEVIDSIEGVEEFMK
jgi:hypothetical protein